MNNVENKLPSVWCYYPTHKIFWNMGYGWLCNRCHPASDEPRYEYTIGEDVVYYIGKSGEKKIYYKG